MKKNMLAIVILAATIVNIALTALMLFTVIPKAQRTDALIQKIVSIIDLELESPDAADYAEIPFADRETYSFAEAVNVILAKRTDSESEKASHAQVSITLVLNKKAESYKTVQPLIAGYEPVIKIIVQEEVGKYTSDNVLANKDEIQKAILKRLGTEFEATDLMVGITLGIVY